ncbi:hypothetical protein [Dactylosporangium sp. NPDC051541]|uniref:hypothetical protein n=1 Tax=Dactylosporangium sp. NPDC051541 TaxID=3363977 RepID=UPI00378C1463
MITALEPDLLQQLTPPLVPQAAAELDTDLTAAVRRTRRLRLGFYLAVLIVALYGSATGAAAAFHLPWWIAVGAVGSLELGGAVFLANADTRRRLGESASTSRLLGAAIAVAAAAFNVMTHPDRLLGGFFALMSILGFVTWWLDSDNQRRDRLRAHGQLPPPPPRYDLFEHWLHRPIVTIRARSIARAYPQLGVYGSLQAAAVVISRERRNRALATVLRRRIRRTAGRRLARIAVHTMDIDAVAQRLRGSADYDGYTAALTAELAVDRVLGPAGSSSAAGGTRHLRKRWPRRVKSSPMQRTPAVVDPVRIRASGEAAVLDGTGQPVPGLRAKSIEVMVYLAGRPGGAELSAIVAHIWPDVDPERAIQRLFTCLSNLRSVIRGVLATADNVGSIDPQRLEPVVNSGGHYRLNPALVAVDIWPERNVDPAVPPPT